MIYNPITARLHILQILADLYIHSVSDKTVKESLAQYAQELSIADVHREFDYLAGLEFEANAPALKITKSKTADMFSAQITSHGIDILTGATNYDGVQSGDSHAQKLILKKDLRRGILFFLNERSGRFVEDVEIDSRFATDGNEAVTVPEIQAHLWYLAGKGFVEAKNITVGTANNYTARITSRGVDVITGVTSVVGIT